MDDILELSNDLLARYKKKASAASSQADREGNTSLANKRFKGVMKATKKQFANDSKLRSEETSMSDVDFYAKYLGYGANFNAVKKIQEELTEAKATQIEDASEVNEDDLKEGFINGREYASAGLMHPDHAQHAMHKVGNTVDFYAHGTGDKITGKVVKNDGKEVHIQAEKGSGGKLHKFKVQRGLPKNESVEEELEEAWPGTPEYEKKYGTKSTGKFDSKKTSTGTVYTKKFKDDDEEGEKKPAAKTAEAPAQTGPKKRGRPVGWRGTYKPRQPKTVKEAFEAIARLDEEDLEAFIDSLQLVEDHELDESQDEFLMTLESMDELDEGVRDMLRKAYHKAAAGYHGIRAKTTSDSGKFERHANAKTYHSIAGGTENKHGVTKSQAYKNMNASKAKLK